MADFSFGTSSLIQLESCDPRLQDVAQRAIRIIDFKVCEGHRDKEKQNKAFAEGKSKVQWPNGKHNLLPSKAFDLAPYPIIWPTPELKKNDFGKYVKVVARFYLLAGVIMTVAAMMGIKLRWGGDWDGDWDLFDQDFDDLGHFELED